MISWTSYRLDRRYCAGEAKNGGENQVAATQRKAKTKTKAREQGKSDPAPMAWRHTSPPVRLGWRPSPRAGGGSEASLTLEQANIDGL
jgi:hypothetical protein